MHNNIMAAGSKERPPMLGPGRYSQWRSRFLRYIDTKPNGEGLRKSILSGPYVPSTVLVQAVAATEGVPAVQQHTTIETVLNMTPENKEHFLSEKEAIFLLLTGIGDEIYSTVDACKTANEMWIAIERLQQGESLNVQDVKTNLFWEFGKFTSRDGESMESYYSRFYKLMNELTRNNLQVTTMQVNVQFLQQLQPEWSRFVTVVKQSKEIDTISYHTLFDILKQYQNEVNDIRAERIAKSANPLALLAAAQPYSDNYYQAPKPQLMTWKFSILLMLIKVWVQRLISTKWNLLLFWVEAMQEELLQFKIQKVWTLVDLPSSKKAIGTKWVYRNKKDERGMVVRNIMDVKSAFLYGTIEEDVYVCQPLGFVDPEFLEKVYKVEKALYGLHQAPRAWYETHSTYLLDSGFHRRQIDKTLFIKTLKGDILLVQVYVDDIIFGSTKKFLCDEFEQIMHNRFQDKYVGKILKKFGFSSIRTASTPMETNKALTKDKDVEDVDVHLYSSTKSFPLECSKKNL
ncbi:retrovirus-related pol polyprotein from transposon TNT 1-94 [Tanacetum coccineum]|uniref:Retrovirus-related pol polyprotein from transposon TNT 1-94 n=1 Tax=Tanacetum coccineum TaxID=301880 RepID=A0ABQ5G8Q9_9ASTR